MTVPTRLLRLPEVLRRCGCGRATVYRLIRVGTFPAPVKALGPHSSAWVEAEIEAWLQARITAARGTSPTKEVRTA